MGRTIQCSRVRVLLCVASVFATATIGWPIGIKTISISTDFDHSGGGSIYNIDVTFSSRHTTVDSPANSSPCCASGTSTAPYLRQIQEYEAARLEQQRKIDELRREAAAAQRAKQADRAIQAIGAVDRIWGVEPDEHRRYALKNELVGLVQQFDSDKTEYRREMSSRLQRLSNSMDHINVPSPVIHYNTVMFFGAGVTPDQAAEAQKNRIVNPFDTKPYDRVLAFGREGFFDDLPRAALDHMLADFDTLSPQVLSQVGAVHGAVIDRLVAHSNGGIVAEVLIRNGYIHVKELDLLGGDGSLMSIDALRELHERTGVIIHVYAAKDDPVPLLPVGWKIRELSEKLRETLPSKKNSEDPTDVVLGLTKPTDETQPGVYVHLLSTPYSWERVVENHVYNSYYAIIRSMELLSNN